MDVSLGGSVPMPASALNVQANAQALRGAQLTGQTANQATANTVAGTSANPAAGGLNPASPAAGNIAGAVNAAQNTNQATPGNASTTSTARADGAGFRGAQMLPGSAPTNLAASTTSGQNSAWMSAARGGATSTGNMAQMLQNFSNSTVNTSAQTVNTSAGQGQVLSPGQGPQIAFTTQPPPGQQATTNPQAPIQNTGQPPTQSGAQTSTNLSPQASTPGASSAPVSPPSSSATSTPPVAQNQIPASSTGPAAGAATLRAEGQNAPQIPQSQTPPPSSGLPLPSAPGAHVPNSAANPAVLATNLLAVTTPEKTAAGGGAEASKRQTSPNVEANPTVGLANPTIRAEEQIPRAPGIPSPSSPDALAQSQAAAAAGWGARMQEALNLELGFSQLTPANLITGLGLLILGLALARVFVNGFDPDEVIVLSGALIVGLIFTVGGSIIGSSSPPKK